MWQLHRQETVLAQSSIHFQCGHMEHTKFALDRGMFFFLKLIIFFFLYETKRRECVIVKATADISKSKEPFYMFWVHSSTVFVDIGTDRNGTHLKLKRKLYSNVLKYYQWVLLIFTHRELLVNSRIINPSSRHNWLNNRKDIKKKNIPQLRAKFVWSVPIKSRGMATSYNTIDYSTNLSCRVLHNPKKRYMDAGFVILLTSIELVYTWIMTLHEVRNQFTLWCNLEYNEQDVFHIIQTL